MEWIIGVYGGSADDTGAGDLPDPDTLDFHRFTEAQLERAKKILEILELTEFRWDINTVLAQPDAELEAVFMLKSIGERVRTHNRREQDPDNEHI